jgi:NAD+ synthase
MPKCFRQGSSQNILGAKMSDTFKITIAQLNPSTGNIALNADKARASFAAGRKAGADMVALTEMFITGYPTNDLVFKPVFVKTAMDMIDALAKEFADGPAVGIGGPYAQGDKLYNAYYILEDGAIKARVLKHILPNSKVFDEKRLFDAADISGPYSIAGVRIGTPICEDAWHADVCEALAESGAEILLIPNGSPYARNKMDERMSLMVARAVETGLPLIYANMVGGQDDLGFDGMSFALNRHGEIAAQFPAFDEVTQTLTLNRGADGWQIEPSWLATLGDEWQLDYRCMVETLRDYMAKTGFSKVLLGLSGGIDSALVAVIAADALGPENVRCVMLPSEYTSQSSLDDAAAVAQRLGCQLQTVPIGASRAAVTETLGPIFDGYKADLTEENIQSRLRGLLLMAMSNKFGEMLLTTGNKSEVAVGYSTIYGDMCGGYNPLKDLYKTRVFEMCRWRNNNHHDWMMAPSGEVIPQTIIEKPPSAELRDDQKDADSLPEYDVLDAILEMLVDGDASVQDVVDKGYDRALVKRIERLIYMSEYKRFQSAPGTRLTRSAFWLDRRYPIASGWRDDT